MFFANRQSRSKLLLMQNFNFDTAGQLATQISRRNPFLAKTFINVQAFQFAPFVASSNGIKILVEP